MVAIGLVPKLTAEAAKRAALTAGARLLDVYSYKLTESDLTRLEQQSPDMILLAGGTDGGDEATIIQNAHSLANSKLNAPVVIGGNRTAANQAFNVLTKSGKEAVVTENVMPEIGKINVQPAQSAIRQIFLHRLIRAKGLEEVQRSVANGIIPTPMASLKAASLLANGTKEEPGLGDLLVIEIGGATTNVYSISEGKPHTIGVIWKGLPEPYEKRTIEGDLGLRYSAPSILESVGEKKILEKSGLSQTDVKKAILEMPLNAKKLPQTDTEASVDFGLSRICMENAVKRHVGSLEPITTPVGTVYVQYGKDLTEVKHVIGTAGGVIYSKDPKTVMNEALYKEAEPLLLRPKKPDVHIDENYILYAIGLLSEIAPDKALRIMKSNLRRL
jgi:uncharacterized protein (TIGR01319 family)